MSATAKNSKTSAAILDLIAKGYTPASVMDAVLGAGTYANLAGGLYDALKAAAR
jgi:hypothetical protein